MHRRAFLTATAAALAGGCAAAQEASSERRSRLLLLGTAGGPTPKPTRSAPAQAIIVGDACYVIDCGDGVARQLAIAGISFDTLRGVFITHHHSDHNADYGNLLLLGWAANLTQRVDTYGPPPLAQMTRQFLDLNAFDIATRVADEGRPPLDELIAPHEITGDGVVLRDQNVTVTAALVDHPPVAPAFAYRFDCPDRSIVISGDTRPSANLVRLARGADILVHEVMYLPALERLIASEPNAPRLREHLLASHTTTEQVGRIASEAGVGTLVLSHMVPGGDTSLTDDIWREAVRPYFSGNIVVGSDSMEL
jgi:ribonuclease BN (tRNA processing enzyme)